MPLHYYVEGPMIISIIGGVIVTIPVIIYLKNAAGLRQILIPSFLFLGLSVLFIVNHSLKKSRELDQNGISTTGKIVDMYAIYSKTNKSYYFKVQYVTEDAVKVTVSELTQKERYKDASIGDEIELIYSKNIPGLIEFVLPVEIAEKELHAFSVGELTSMLELHNANLGSILNKDGVKWMMNSFDSSWINIEDKSRLTLLPKIELLLTYPAFQIYPIYDALFKKSNFKLIEEMEFNKAVFKYGSYTLILKSSLRDGGVTDITLKK